MCLQGAGCFLQRGPGGGHFHAGLLEQVLPVVHVFVAGGHGHAQDLAVHGIALGQAVVFGGFGVAQIQQIVLEAGQGEGFVEHDVGQLVGRGAHLHGVPVLGVVLDLFHFDLGVRVLLLELAHHVVFVDVVHQVVVPDGKDQLAREAGSGAAGRARSGGAAARTAASGQAHGCGGRTGSLQERTA